MYNELIDALRYCGFDDRKPCNGCVLYDKTHGVDCLEKLHRDAADAIERLQAENDELRARWSAATIEGFPVKDLMLFAQVCRGYGVREKDLQTFARNMEKAFEIVRKEFDDSIQKSMNRVFQYGVELNDACRKQNREEKPDDPIRPN